MTANTDRPIILCVDDDEAVLGAVANDLRRQYGSRCRIVSAPSGPAALEVVDQRRLAGDAIAIVVADQRMPDMTGTELLEQVKIRYPDVRTTLLTAYADTQAAIDAINRVKLDHYIMKPWDPPEELLFPILDELLEDWEASRPPRADAVRLVGDRWSSASHQLRDYLARNRVPYTWIDVENEEQARPLLAAAPDARLPLVVLDDGRALADPTIRDVAGALSLHTHEDTDFHDLVIVGGGPAGLAAAVYGRSEGLSTALVEAEATGGQAGLSARIENYLGFPSGISGSELARRAHAQAMRFGTDLYSPNRAVELRREDPYRVVVLDDGTELRCRVVAIASGVQYRRLEAPGVERLTGAGIYYGAASTESTAMKGGRVVVVGGANSAGQAALHLARFAREVLIVIRGDSLRKRMSTYLVDRIDDTANIRTVPGSRVSEVGGETRLESVTLVSGDESETIPAVGMFVFIGAQPRTDWLDGSVLRDQRGFVLTGGEVPAARWNLDRLPHLLETSVPAVFAVGDVRANSVKRVASAVGEGSVMVSMAHAVIAT